MRTVFGMNGWNLIFEIQIANSIMESHQLLTNSVPSLFIISF